MMKGKEKKKEIGEKRYIIPQSVKYGTWGKTYNFWENINP